MTAVLCRTNADFSELRMFPVTMFKQVMNVNDVRGRKFTGVLAMPGWYRNKDIEAAIDCLRARQPELFTKD